MERDGGMRYPVRSSDVATLCALQRAGRWVTSAAVTAERADCCDSSLDRVASSLGSLVNAGLVERRQNPQRKARQYLWCVNDEGEGVVASYGAIAVAEITTHAKPDDAVDMVQLAS